MKLENKWAVSAVIGVILMVAITVAIAAVTFAYSTGLIGTPEEETPVISFQKDDIDKTLMVLNADPNLNWDDIEVIGTATEPPGTIVAGDMITGCSGEVGLIWIPANTLLGTWTFT